ncbi:hypothetical protein SJ021_28300, partial [Klebsiella oxytoca]|nr:hypothetical protein [Klebsiella oxytoca]
MKIIEVSYGPTEGVSISGLYLRETTTTQKSGTLLGGGLSQSGVVLGGGGYSGSETNQTGRSAMEGANKRGNSSRLTQSFHFFMFEPIF